MSAEIPDMDSLFETLDQCIKNQQHKKAIKTADDSRNFIFVVSCSRLIYASNADYAHLTQSFSSHQTTKMLGCAKSLQICNLDIMMQRWL
jgi:hypothetical protein